MKKPHPPHNGTPTAPPASVQGSEDEDHKPVTLWDLEDPVYGLRGRLLKARAISVFAQAADLGELVLDEPDKETLAHLMQVIIEQLDAADRMLDDYLKDEWACKKGTTSP